METAKYFQNFWAVMLCIQVFPGQYLKEKGLIIFSKETASVAAATVNGRSKLSRYVVASPTKVNMKVKKWHADTGDTLQALKRNSKYNDDDAAAVYPLIKCPAGTRGFLIPAAAAVHGTPLRIVAAI